MKFLIQANDLIQPNDASCQPHGDCTHTPPCSTNCTLDCSTMEMY